MRTLMRKQHNLRLITHAQSCGQSAAVRSGVAAARAPVIVTLDGDGQNDPAFIPALLRRSQAIPKSVSWPASVSGERPGVQENTVAHCQRRSKGRAARRHTRYRLRPQGVSPRPVFDTALFRRAAPFSAGFDTARGLRRGLRGRRDRAGLHGVSNYGLWDRLWVGILDLAGVWWLIRRRKRVPRVSEVAGDAG